MKLNLGILFGGRSSEHQISILSGSSIIKNIAKGKYNIIPIFIDKDGKWFLIHFDEKNSSLNFSEKYEIKYISANSQKIKTEKGEEIKIDVIFPALHGPYGEDGTIQGMLEILNIPYVGCGVLASSLAMDKISTKRILSYCRLPVAPFLALFYYQWEENYKLIIQKVENKFKYPVFVKPSNLGSSIGISKAHNREELIKGVELAKDYDDRIIIEKGIDAREIECSVMGNKKPIASIPGEIIPAQEFYNYKAKYEDPNTKLQIPALLSKKEIKQVQDLSIKAYLALNCKGLARVDFLMDKNNHKFYIGEINTIPGFTEFSMYHRLWSLSGISFTELLDRLISYALSKNA